MQRRCDLTSCAAQASTVPLSLIGTVPLMSKSCANFLMMAFACNPCMPTSRNAQPAPVALRSGTACTCTGDSTPASAGLHVR